jgi:hypothetical protein
MLPRAAKPGPPRLEEKTEESASDAGRVFSNHRSRLILLEVVTTVAVVALAATVVVT